MTLSNRIKQSQTVRNHSFPGEPAIKPDSSIIQLCFVFVLVVVGCIIYSNTLQSPFVFDDHEFILKDPACRMTLLSWDAIAKAAFESRGRHRLIPNISFALNYYFGRYGIFGYHLVNIVIHLLSSIFLFFFVKNTLKIHYSLRNKDQPRPDACESVADPILIAFFTAMVWMVNPVQTQAVTYICQRMTSMAAMFYILSFFFYVKGRIRMRAGHPMRAGCALYFLGCIISGACAFASKENTATLPLFILIYEWFFFQNLRSFLSKRRLIWVVCASILFACIAIIYLGNDPIQRILASYTRRNFTLGQRVLTEFRVVIYYVSLLAWPSPVRLNLDYDYPLSYSLIHPWTTLSCLIAILALIYMVVIAAKKDRLLSFTILWFLGNLVIESSVIGIEIIFEHRTYLPFMMAALLPVIFIFRHTRRRQAAVLILCVIVSLLSVWTFQRNMIWKSEVSLWQDCSSKSPQKFRPVNNYGLALFNAGYIDQAIAEYQKALRIVPEEPNALVNKGNALVIKNQLDKAISNYLAALKVNPKKFEAHINLADTLVKKGLLDDAVFHYLKALTIKPDDAIVHKRLGKVLFKQNKLNESEIQLKKAIALQPEDWESYNMLGVVMVRKNNINHSIAYFKKALEFKPDYDFAKKNLRGVLSLQKKDNMYKTRKFKTPVRFTDVLKNNQ